MTRYLLAIDQGTTSSRAIVFDQTGNSVATDQQEFHQYFPKDGWVEHDAMEIWNDTLALCQQALRNARVEARELAGIGITNQRETTVLWDRQTGDPLAKAIVWQDRRTADLCQRLRDAGHEEAVRNKTGLLLDPYFSATKLAWLLDNVPGARQRAEAGELAFGTVDSWLVWNLTDGAEHLTDVTNASRTLMYDIHTGDWDDDLLEIFDVPRSMLPEVRSSSEVYAPTSGEINDNPGLAAFPHSDDWPEDTKAAVGQTTLITNTIVAHDQHRARFTVAAPVPAVSPPCGE